MTIDEMISGCFAEFVGDDATSKIVMCEDLNLAVIRDHSSQVIERQVYEPLFCLVLQGQKEIVLGARRVVLEPLSGLIVSHELPVATRVLDGTRDQPYFALVLRLDMKLVRGLFAEVGDALPRVSTVHSVDAGKADPSLIDAMGRLFALRRDPLEARVLEPLIQREIHFRLLMAYHGGMLRELLRVDSHAGRVAQAIRHIQDNYRCALTVGELAALSAMSQSSFHHHFRAVTGRSPLQYQKAIRLLEAKRLLADENRLVSDVALDVGYESPTQFSREYSREFGSPPSLRD